MLVAKLVEVALPMRVVPKVEDALLKFWRVDEPSAVIPPESCAEPWTSRMASEVVALPPINTWFEVVETRIPELLK